MLPVYLNALPLKSDYSENDNVYKCLANLFQFKHPVLLSQNNLNASLSAAYHGLKAEQVESETRQMLVNGLKNCFGDAQISPALMQTVSTFPEEVAGTIQMALQS